jgi:hypothetical protein
MPRSAVAARLSTGSIASVAPRSSPASTRAATGPSKKRSQKRRH